MIHVYTKRYFSFKTFWKYLENDDIIAFDKNDKHFEIQNSFDIEKFENDFLKQSKVSKFKYSTSGKWILNIIARDEFLLKINFVWNHL